MIQLQCRPPTVLAKELGSRQLRNRRGSGSIEEFHLHMGTMCWFYEDGFRTCTCILDLWIQPIICLTVLVLSLPAVHEYTESEQFGVLGQIAYLSTGLLSPLLLAGNFASIWTICYIAVQRYRAILRPLSSMHSPLRPFRPLIGIALAALLLNASKWAEYRWIWIEVNNNTRTVLVHQPSDLAYNETYLQVFDHILYPVLIYLIPLLLLSVLNFRILSHISAQRVAFDHKSRLAQERRSVTLLISIVILFFVCHTGGLVIRFVDRSKYLESTVYVLFKDGINLLFNINSMANPMLYFLFTRQFRDLRTGRTERARGHSAPSVYRSPCEKTPTMMDYRRR
ncbi:hypothetical protein RB195_001251 [Necator americanus]|uniref:G-protein coupled receptors family 1 profile domain-containing protein n=1 Tax=Necator americanus TaxID=51031 RepID=A0ABR1DEZ9_NECAM